jgi:comEA protein
MENFKKNLPFIITMSVFVAACAVVTAYTIRNEPQYVEVVTSYLTTAVGSHAAGGTPVNINYADSEELQTLPGIGEVRALAIIAYREEHGGFLYVEELMEVSGIGPALFENIRDYVYVGYDG